MMKAIEDRPDTLPAEHIACTDRQRAVEAAEATLKSLGYLERTSTREELQALYDAGLLRLSEGEK
jgi:hypothetical protein